MKVIVGKSQALYSSVTRRGKDKNSGLLTIGAVAVDIPQHPVVLHGMMTRGSKQLSSTLQVLPSANSFKFSTLIWYFNEILSTVLSVDFPTKVILV